MKRNWLFLSIAMLFLLSTSYAQNGILIEAEQFRDKGGWSVDQQFEEEMGSPYLLAHGMGKAVANATTKIAISKTGTYHVWVRTKDWASGNWDAPGQFNILINGKVLPSTFGTQKGWDWQYGKTIEIKAKEAVVELQDLTGFDGRCDAIFLSKSAKKPPIELEALKKWREKQTPNEKMKFTKQDFDVVVVGGGTAGCGAAIAAAERGLHVALVNDRPLFGGNASSEIRVHTLGIHGNAKEILEKIDTEHYPNGHADAIIDQEKREKSLREYDLIKLFPSCRAFAVATKKDKIESVDVREITTGKLFRMSAPVFIDCTGDGWIGYWAGADYRYGRESATEFDEGWDKHKELWSPEKPDNRVMGSSVLWNSEKRAEKTNFPEVPWAMSVAKNHEAINGEWYWEYSTDELNQIENGEVIRDHMLKAIYGSFYNAKQKEGNEKVTLKWVSYLLGKRESRRLLGDYIYTLKDEVSGEKFDDAVVEEIRAVDVHYQLILEDENKPDFLSEAMFKKTPKYYIPFRSLYSRNISNLMMAGRNFSCSHVGLGGPRVMNTTGQMGVATGFAAYLCVKYKTTPRNVYKLHLNELKELTGYQEMPE